MSRAALDGAQLLLRDGMVRGAVSRAYCAVAGELVSRGVTFPHNWQNPAHDQLPDLILNNSALPRHARFEVNKALRRLRKGREDADYRPGATIGIKDAVRYCRDAALILKTLRIPDE